MDMGLNMDKLKEHLSQGRDMRSSWEGAGVYPAIGDTRH